MAGVGWCGLRSMAVAAGLVVLGGCQSGSGESEAEPESALAEGEETSGQAPSGQATQEPREDGDPGDTARIWVGVWCEQPTLDPIELVFYLNGGEIQRLDTTCRQPDGTDDAPPNGGQFAVEIPAGTHTLRVEDVTHDAHAEQELHIGDHSWVVVRHRRVGGRRRIYDEF